MENKSGFKIVVFGPYGAGKTNIINRFIGNPFDKSYPATGGGGYYNKSLMLEGRSFIADIWDTGGATKYKSLTKLFLKDAKGAFVVYDITNKDSFDEIDEWIGLLKEAENNDIPMIIVGNRCDLKKERKVTVEECELKAMKYGADFIEVSALSGENIQKAFEILMKKVTGIGAENYKSKYDKLKQDFDKLLQSYNKLKEDNEKLSNELIKAKCTIFNIEDKVKKNLNEINNLNKIILQKDDEIINIKLNVKNLATFKTKSFNNDDILFAHFISSDQNINCPIKCLKTDTFAEVEEKLYQKYQEFRETNNKFISNGKIVMRFKTITENNINDGDKIELIKF